jgi:predicted enzyme related to lactoylglutathione lyase
VLRLNHITFACEEPERLSGFWAALLEYESERGADDWFARGDGPELRFDRVPKSPTIELPIHLDVNVPDREGAVAQALDLGAGLVVTKTDRIAALEETFTVLRDPEGNGFCVQQDSRAEHPYVGNVTFAAAEPERLAHFWSEALGWPVEDVGEDFLQQLRDARLDPAEFSAYGAIRNPDGTRPRFYFHRRQKTPTDAIPIHVDFLSDDREADVDRLARAGATVGETRTAAEHTWTVLRDPEGNPFCVE